jgi:hypothetical protein
MRFDNSNPIPTPSAARVATTNPNVGKLRARLFELIKHLPEVWRFREDKKQAARQIRAVASAWMQTATPYSRTPRLAANTIRADCVRPVVRPGG